MGLKSGLDIVVLWLVALPVALALLLALLKRLKDRVLDEMFLSGEISLDEYVEYRMGGRKLGVRVILGLRRRKVIS